jgi:hypothetical protein
MFCNLMKPMLLGCFCCRLPLQVVGCHIIMNCVFVLFYLRPATGCYSLGIEFLQLFIKRAELVADIVGICENDTHMPSPSSSQQLQIDKDRQ